MENISVWRIAGGVLIFFLSVIGVPAAINSWGSMLSPAQVAASNQETAVITRLITVVESFESSMPMLEETLSGIQQELFQQGRIVDRVSDEVSSVRSEIDRRFLGVDREIGSLWGRPTFNNTVRVDKNLDMISELRTDSTRHESGIKQNKEKIEEHEADIQKLRDAYSF